MGHPGIFPYSGFSQVPTGAPKTLFTLSYPLNNFPTDIWDSGCQRTQGQCVNPEGHGRCLKAAVSWLPTCVSLSNAAPRDLVWAF